MLLALLLDALSMLLIVMIDPGTMNAHGDATALALLPAFVVLIGMTVVLPAHFFFFATMDCFGDRKVGACCASDEGGSSKQRLTRAGRGLEVREAYHNNPFLYLFGVRCDLAPLRSFRMPLMGVCASISCFKLAAIALLLGTSLSATPLSSAERAIEGIASSSGVRYPSLSMCSEFRTCFNSTPGAINAEGSEAFTHYFQTLYGVDKCGRCSGFNLCEAVVSTSGYMIVLQAIIWLCMLMDLAAPERKAAGTCCGQRPAAASAATPDCGTGQEGVLAEAIRVERFHPTSEKLLMQTELRFAQDRPFHLRRPGTFALTVAVALVFGYLRVMRVFSLGIHPSRGEYLAGYEWFAVMLLWLANALWMHCLLAFSFALWLAYHDGLQRLKLATEFLQMLLTWSAKYFRVSLVLEKAADDSETSDLLAGSLSMPDADFVAELHAWTRTRRFYINTLLPLVFTCAAPGVLTLLLLFLACSLYTSVGILVYAQKFPMDSVITYFLEYMFISVTIAVAVVFMLVEAVYVGSETELQVSLVREFLADADLLRNTQSLPSSVLADARTEARLLVSQPGGLLRVTRRDSIDARNSLTAARRAHGHAGSGVAAALPERSREAAEQFDAFCTALAAVSEQMDAHGGRAKVMGIEITPVIIQTLTGYIGSLGASVGLYMLQDTASLGI